MLGVHWWQSRCNSNEFKFNPHPSRSLLYNNHKAECLQSTQPFPSCSHPLESRSQSLDTDSHRIPKFWVSTFGFRCGTHWKCFLPKFKVFGFEYKWNILWSMARTHWVHWLQQFSYFVQNTRQCMKCWKQTLQIATHQIWQKLFLQFIKRFVKVFRRNWHWQ